MGSLVGETTGKKKGPRLSADKNFKLIIPLDENGYRRPGLFRVVLSRGTEEEQRTGPIANQSTADMPSDRSTKPTPRHVAFVTVKRPHGVPTGT